MAAHPALAQVTRQDAINLCMAQPALDSSNLVPAIREQLARPHDRALDRVPLTQLVRDTQQRRAAACADEMIAHPDVFSAIAIQQFVFNNNWVNAWVAFNTNCRDRLTGACIEQHVEATATIRPTTLHDPGPPP